MHILLGHGKTPFNEEKLSLKDFSEQLLNILDYLKIDKINLLGFSLGSLIALNFWVFLVILQISLF